LLELCPSIAYHYYLKKTEEHYIGLVLQSDTKNRSINKNFFSGWVWNRFGLMDEWSDTKQENIINKAWGDPSEYDYFDLHNNNDYMEN
jgi:hypothetical protein